jgi:alanine racemase
MIRQSGRDPAPHWLDVDLGAVRRNADAVAARAGVPILPMVKADAYGLGVAAVVRALEGARTWGYGVSSVVEGEELRAAGVTRPVLVFTPLLPAQFRAARAAALTPVLGDPASIAAWTEPADGAPWHLGVDTGMGRAGVRWDDVTRVRELARRSPPAGACTHFHSAELADRSVEEQCARFDVALATLAERPPLLHAENSAAVARVGASAWSLVRPGIFLYGVDAPEYPTLRAEPVATLQARVVELRDLRAGDSVSYLATYRADGARRIATTALGYADGYRRALGNRGQALVGGRLVPVAGLVTMDMTMLDVTGVACEVGDVATFIDTRTPALTVAAVAAAADLSPYELLVGLGLRVPRRHAGVDA